LIIVMETQYLNGYMPSIPSPANVLSRILQKTRHNPGQGRSYGRYYGICPCVDQHRIGVPHEGHSHASRADRASRRDVPRCISNDNDRQLSARIAAPGTLGEHLGALAAVVPVAAALEIEELRDPRARELERRAAPQNALPG
jgi:hypothetical protein